MIWKPATLDMINVVKRVHPEQNWPEDIIQTPPAGIGHDDDLDRWVEINLPDATDAEKAGPLNRLMFKRGLWVGPPKTKTEKKLAKIVADIYDDRKRRGKNED